MSKNTIFKGTIAFMKDLFADPFFWALYEAERSPDPKELSKLYDIIGE